MSERISFIEIELPKCQNVYGVAPCTAAVGVTGEDKCFNCRNTCQDLANITEADEIVRYSVPSTLIDFDLDAVPNITVPNIQNIDYSPPVLELGESIGVRASLTVTFKDSRSPDTDAAGDPYRAERSYDPYTVGTYWGKFRARFPSLRGQKIYWIQGTSDEEIGNMERRQFIIETSAGPDVNGTYKITAKDALKVADGDRAIAPKITRGRLAAAISDTDTTAVLNPIGIGNEEYPTSGKIALGGSEIVSFTRSNDTLTLTARGQNNTEAVEHDADSAAVNCLEYIGERPEDIFYDLLVNFAGTDPSFVPLADWVAESAEFNNRVYSTLIATPASVKDLINELLQQTASTMWWDNQAGLIRWQVLRNQATSAEVYRDQNVQRGSMNIVEQTEKRVSRCYVHYGQINPLLDLNEFRNYRSHVLRTELGSEPLYGDEPAYREIYSRWIPEAARATAEQLGDLILQRYSIPPRKVGFKLLRDSGVEIPELAGSYDFSSQFLQNPDGSPKVIPIQATSVKPMNDYFTIIAEEILFNEIVAPVDPDQVPIFIDNNTQNVNIRDLFNQLAPAPTASTTVNVYVGEGVIVGSSATNQPALRFGAWPAGVTINLINNGIIAGAGGDGGRGGSVLVESYRETVPPPASGIVFTAQLTEAPTPGAPGGLGILVDFDVNIDNQGIIGGGGGGGGGGGAAYAIQDYQVSSPDRVDDVERKIAAVNGQGGSGGAGSIAGSGASTGVRTVTTEDYFFNVFGGKGVDYFHYVGPFSLAQAGLAGSTLLGGAKRFGGYNDSRESDGRGPRINIAGDFGGRAGNLGQNGVSGVVPSIGLGTPSDNDRTDLQFGEPGGAAGDAIEQTGGVVTFITTGDIRGAIT